jgi:hypothetical protein
MGHTALKKHLTEFTVPVYLYPSIYRNNLLDVQLLEQLEKDYQAIDEHTVH